jgi:hypothetical protein
MPTPSVEQIYHQVKEAFHNGLLCSQAVIHIGLRQLGLKSDDLVKGAGGLVGAMGFQGVTCGALTSAACLIVYAAQDKLDRATYPLIEELEERFNQLAEKYPGNCCSDILEFEPEKLPAEVCYPLIASAIHTALDLLEREGIKGEDLEEHR